MIGLLGLFSCLSDELKFIFFFHVQKKPLVERHSGNEISGDLHPLPLPAQGGNEEGLCLDHDVVEVNCEQVRISILRCCQHVFFSYRTFLKG